MGYALFAVCLGIAAEVLLRRTLPTLAVTLGGFAVARLFVADFVRQHYMTPVTTAFSYAGQGFRPAGSAWVFAAGSVGPNGVFYPPGSLGQRMEPFVNGMPLNVPAVCDVAASQSATGSRIQACAASHGYRGFFTYQPASRFWAFQGIETGIFVLFAVALIGVAAFVLLRRDA